MEEEQPVKEDYLRISKEGNNFNLSVAEKLLKGVVNLFKGKGETDEDLSSRNG